MGTFLKIVGALALAWFGFAAIGCTMILGALTHARPASTGTGTGYGASSGYGGTMGSARARDDVIEAIRDDNVDLAQLPGDLRDPSSVTVTFRDGRTRTLGSSPSDRFVRALLAARAESRARGSAFGATSDAYDEPNQPHFKPGEPMIDPTPSERR